MTDKQETTSANPLTTEWNTTHMQEEQPPLPQPTTNRHSNIDAYFDPESGLFFRRNSDGNYQRTQRASIGNYLESIGFSSKKNSNDVLSPKKQALEYLEVQRTVDYAGPLAGQRVGLKYLRGRKILVTESPNLINPSRGSWPLLKQIFIGLLGEEQCKHFYGWLKVALVALRKELHQPGQALTIAGPPGCGKSLCQAIITELLGGREADPFSHMVGTTDFNSELFSAEHLKIEDKADSADPRKRRHFGAQIKNITVNRQQKAHKKNREALTLYPFWRLSITLNDDPGALQVLPQFEDGVRDKITLLKASRFEIPIDTSESTGQELLWTSIQSELPGFIDFLLREFEIEEAWVDPRFGVKAYHNPTLLELIDSTSDDFKLMELIDETPNIFGPNSQDYWEGPAARLEETLVFEHGRIASRLLNYNSACGQLLAQLKKKTSRVSSRIVNGQTQWRIVPSNRL